MKFYPSNDLYWYYKKYADNAWLSSRIQDHTIKRTLDVLNRAINCCDKWDSFIDIGAGNGRNCTTLLHKFQKGYAVEIDPNDALIHVSQENKRLKLFLKPIQSVKLKDKVDFVLLSDVFEHIPIPDVEKVVKAISSIQNIGGVVYILTPNPIFCGPAEKSGIYYKRHKFGHYKHYTETEVQRHFSQYGYTTIFSCYEDSRVRLVLKMPMVILSFLDKKFLSRRPISLLTFPFTFILDKMLWLIAQVSHLSEILHQDDKFSTRSLVMVLKKIE